MSNMSYCRFENTLADFLDCVNEFNDMINGESKPLKGSERKSALTLLKEAVELISSVAEYSNIELNDLLDDTKLETAFDNINEAADAYLEKDCED